MRGQRMREAELEGTPACRPEAGYWEADLPERRKGWAHLRKTGDGHARRPGRGLIQWEH